MKHVLERNFIKIVLLLLILGGYIFPAQAQTIIYVDAGATGVNNGSSWADAYTALQDAFDQIFSNTSLDYEVRVAKGIYYPDEDNVNNRSTDVGDGTDHLEDSVDESFEIVTEYVVVKGGYPTGGGTRNPKQNITVLSGDITQDDLTNIHGVTTKASDVNGANSEYVFRIDQFSGPAENVTVDGLVITAGSDSTNFLSGGGMGGDGDFTLRDVTFAGNHGGHGGALLTDAGVDTDGPSLINVYFVGNSATNGGAMANLVDCDITLTPTLKNVVFVNNSATNSGGAIWNNSCNGSINAILNNVTFFNNVAQNDGNSIYHFAENSTKSRPIIKNSTFYGSGDQIYNVVSPSNPDSTEALVINSLIKGIDQGWNASLGADGGGNFDADPLFVDDSNALGADQISGTNDDGLHLQPFSPAIDAGIPDTTGLGLPATDLDGSVRVKGTVDIGAYESGLNLNIPGSEGWRTMASPLASQSYAELLDTLWTQGATGADVSGGTPNVYTWDEATASFQAVSDMSNIPGAGSGLVHFVFDDQDFDATPDGFPKHLSVTGNESSGPVGIGVSSTDENSGGTIDGDEGWNLLGNPFSTPISVDAILSAAQAVDPSVNANVYVWDHSSGSYSVFPESNGHTIAPWQSFWVRYTDVGVNGTLSLDRATAKTDSATFQKVSTPRGLNFTLSRDQLNSSFKIILDEGSKTGPDRKDAYRLTPLSSQYVSLYSNQDEVALAHNHLPANLNESIEIPLYVDAAGSDRSTLRLSWKPEQLPKGWEFSLKDTQTGRIISLTEAGQYSFEVTSTKEKTKTLDQASTPDPPQHSLVPTVLKAKAANLRFVLAINPSGRNNLADIPEQAELNQNYPNPFNPTTVIRYGVPKQANVQLNIYDALGRKVRTLIDEQRPAGRYEASFNASELASGLYFYRLKVGANVLTKKMMLIK